MYSKKHIKKLLRIASQKKLLLPAGFTNRSHNWVQKQYNGAGAEWMPKFVRRWMTLLLQKMEAAVLVHDCEYSFVKKSYYQFTIANLRLAANGAKCGHPIAGAVCAVLCQLFGWAAYRDGKESMSYCNYYKETKSNGNT